MPFGDGTGPAGQGAGTGRGQGRGGGRGRMDGNRPGAGPSGFCVCSNPNCKNRMPHQVGKPCYEMKCSKCGSRMVRE